jgi:hypothetical protein
MSPGAGRSGQNSRDGPGNGMPSYENGPFAQQLNI